MKLRFWFRRQGLAILSFLALMHVPVCAQIPCDLNADGACNVQDIDLLASSISTGQASADVNDDGLANTDDLEFFLANALNRLNGDLDLLGSVQFADFLRLSQNFGAEGTWSQGDLTADGVIQFPDFLILADQFGKSAAVMQPRVTVDVTEQNGLYIYEYTVASLQGSPAGINTVFIDVADDERAVEGTPIGRGRYLIDAPLGWLGGYEENVPNEEVSFVNGACGSAGIAVGESETFTIESEFAPGERSMFVGNLLATCDRFFATATIDNVLAPSFLPGAGEAAAVPEPDTSTLLFWVLLASKFVGRFAQRPLRSLRT